MKNSSFILSLRPLSLSLSDYSIKVGYFSLWKFVSLTVYLRLYSYTFITYMYSFAITFSLRSLLRLLVTLWYYFFNFNFCLLCWLYVLTESIMHYLLYALPLLCARVRLLRNRRQSFATYNELPIHISRALSATVAKFIRFFSLYKGFRFCRICTCTWISSNTFSYLA